MECYLEGEQVCEVGVFPSTRYLLTDGKALTPAIFHHDFT